ncbi:hypothetical protein LSH36_167g01033 [Paralvinella palmiformis]|uniref:RNA-binding protein 4 n=1 Tax=Paralvinella palmiformis TaxID=53620 RepID=A0AAD9JUN3_9ANNE|nr:hypothetical protein LSH36_167g01033 [Paralvinella palmiformis]
MFHHFRITTKLFVSKLPDTVRKIDLQKLCEQYGTVVECDFVKKYAFVHFSKPEEAAEAVKNLDNTEFQGTKITVQFSHSTVRQRPGMGQTSACYRCGKYGHWSRDCPMTPQSRGHANKSRSADRGYYDRDPYARGHLTPVIIERSRGAMRYDPYTRQMPPPVPQPAPPIPSLTLNSMYTIDPYSRPPPEYYHIPTIQSLEFPHKSIFIFTNIICYIFDFQLFGYISAWFLLTSPLLSDVASSEDEDQLRENSTKQLRSGADIGAGGAGGRGGYLEARQKCMVYCEQTINHCMETCSRGKKLCRKACFKGVADCKTQCHIQFRDLAPPIDPEHLDDHIDHEHEDNNEDHLYFDEKYHKKNKKNINRHVDHLAKYRSEL